MIDLTKDRIGTIRAWPIDKVIPPRWKRQPKFEPRDDESTPLHTTFIVIEKVSHANR